MKLKGDENIMPTNKNGDTCCSRRGFLTKSTSLLVGGTVGAYAASAPAKTAVPAPATPPLPWKWVKLDPLEAGRRAYRYYAHGGCGYAAYMALLSLLREKVRYPWTTLPDKMMVHAAAGYGGHGTLCGALGGACCIINLVAYKDEDDIYRQIIDKLFYWYAGVSIHPVRRHISYPQTDQGQGDDTIVPYVGLKMDAERRRPGNVEGEKRALRQGGRRSCLHRHSDTQ
jgi:hypothetical protein